MAQTPSDIFGKPRLTPNQLRVVAERRFDDAMCLFNSGDRGRLNGAMYMGGFVIECLLKALLLERHPNLESMPDPAKLSVSDRKIFAMLFSHDLALMLDALPEIRKKLRSSTTGPGSSALRKLSDVCEEWTVYARYATRNATLESAGRFPNTIGEVRKWLREF